MAKAKQQNTKRSNQTVAVDISEAPAEQSAPSTNGATDEDAKRPRIGVSILPDLKTALEKASKDQDLPEAGIVRKAIYAYLNLDMPAGELLAATKRKYASDAERKQARTDRNSELKDILALARMAKEKGIDLATLVAQASAASSN